MEMEALADQFCGHFNKGYLPALQHCQKWQNYTENIIPGTVVMIVRHQLPRALWTVGMVKDVHLSADSKCSGKGRDVPEITFYI